MLIFLDALKLYICRCLAIRYILKFHIPRCDKSKLSLPNTHGCAYTCACTYTRQEHFKIWFGHKEILTENTINLTLSKLRSHILGEFSQNNHWMICNVRNCEFKLYPKSDWCVRTRLFIKSFSHLENSSYPVPNTMHVAEGTKMNKNFLVLIISEFIVW